MHHMLRAAEVSPRGAVQPLVRLRYMLRADARVPVLPRASDDVARAAPCVISDELQRFRFREQKKTSAGAAHIAITSRLTTHHTIPTHWLWVRL